MGKSGNVTGYKYKMGLHMGLGRGPVDELVEIRIGDRRAWRGSATTNSEWLINEPDLFGGKDREGGIVGTFALLLGAAGQGVHGRLSSMLGGLVPAFRGVTTFFFDGLVCANSPYPKPWAFRVRRVLAGWDQGAPWYPEKAVVELASPTAGEVIRAMNPAHVLYECLTNSDWGRGLPAARLDDAAYRAAAATLHAEGFGLCLKWSRADQIGAFMQMVLDHIGGSQFVDPTSGLVTLLLVRDDYDAAALPLFDADSGLLEVEEDDNASQATAVNEVQVRWRNPVDGKPGTVRVRNAAAIQALGGVASAGRDYLGLPTALLATRVAQRDLRAGSGFLKRFKVRLDRRGVAVLPGSVFRVRDLSRGIDGMVLRAGRVEHGPLADGSVSVTAVQDAFGLPATSYVTAQASAYVPPDVVAQPPLGATLFEIPYRDIVSFDAAAVEKMGADGAYVGAVAGQPTGMSIGFELVRRVGNAGAFSSAGFGAFAAAAILSADVDQAATSVAVDMAFGMGEVVPGSVALLGGETVRVDSVDLTGGLVTLGRGCADTVPVAHAAGSTLLVYEGGLGVVDKVEYATGVVVQGKLLTATTAARMDVADAETHSVTCSQRAARPYPPGDVTVCGQRYPASVVGPFVLEWAHRDRVVQADQLVDTTMSGVLPEPGVLYSAEVWDAGADVLLAFRYGMTESYWTPEIYGAHQLRVLLWAVRGGLASAQRHEIAVSYVLVRRLLDEADLVICTEAGDEIHLDFPYTAVVSQALQTESGVRLATEAGVLLFTG